jgi:hypothetical protein
LVVLISDSVRDSVQTTGADRRLRVSPELCWAVVFSLIVIVISVVPALRTPARVVHDSAMYLATPSLSSGRPPLVPLVYQLLGHNVRAIAAFQCLFGAVCWSVLLREVARVRPTPIRAMAMVGVAGVACSTYVVSWYATILSESLSISLLALLVALLARWQRTRTGFWAVVVVAGLWALTRSTNGYIVFLVGLVALPYAVLRGRRRVTQALSLLAAGLLAAALSGQGQLWQQPFTHSLTERILPSPRFTDWFAAHGMPVDATLRRLAGPDTTRTDAALRGEPALEPFRQWMNRSGQRTYMEFLATHPAWILRGTFGGHAELSPGSIGYYGRSRPWLPAPLRNLFLSHRQTTLLGLVALDVAVLMWGARRRKWTARSGLWLGVMGLAVVTLAIDWAGDPWEIGRHSVQGTVGAALAGVMLITCFESSVIIGKKGAPYACEVGADRSPTMPGRESHPYGVLGEPAVGRDAERGSPAVGRGPW